MKHWFKHAIFLFILSGAVACGGGSDPAPVPDRNNAPTANAGAAQAIDTGTVVSLNANASSDADGDTLVYQWSLSSTPAGSAATLSDTAAVAPTFTADIDGTYLIQLIVNDGTVGSAAVTVSVVATTPNVAPTANAGVDQAVDTGASVTLNGAASADADNDTITYLWSITAPTGSSASFSDATAESPSFAADVDGTYTAELIVNDGTVNSAADSVTVVASTPNSAPIANAGADQNINTGALVALDGTASSDINGDSISYLWILTAPTGSIAALVDSTIASPSFTADIDGTYTAQLTVNDGALNSAIDLVSIVATTLNSAPVANAGIDQSINTGSVVTLTGGSSSDADGDSLTFQWALVTVPLNSAATLDNATLASPKFTADADGSYVAELIVNDGTVNSTSDSVTIVASTANSAPMANAGIDQSVVANTVVNLDGTASSDPDGDQLSYQWSFLSIPANSTAVINSPTTAAPNFTPDLVGTYTAQLLVNDGQVSSVADTVNVEASIVNSAPVANAGEDQYVTTATQVTLDGTASTDANGDSLTYSWSFVSVPAGSQATFSGNGGSNPTFNTDFEGSYVISLTASDGTDSSTADTMQVLVSDATVILSLKEGDFGNTFNAVPFSYASDITLNVQSSNFALNTFRLTAQGGDLTITNLQAVNTTNALVPSFSVISDGFVLNNGMEIEFDLDSPATNGNTINLRYSFEIQETGQTFIAIYRYKSDD